MEFHHNLIGGEWVEGSGSVDNINPSNTNDVIGEFARAGISDTERAIEAADATAPAWGASGIQQRHDILKVDTG